MPNTITTERAIVDLSERVHQLEFTVARLTGESQALVNWIRESNGLEPLDFKELERVERETRERINAEIDAAVRDHPLAPSVPDTTRRNQK
ncbi:hypothetical protein [Rhodococcus sp. NPDC127528]|uniref:hypothetical protein n=1 Tax=unclassified Rhodococcus (in: high G+C Gram-positive bacteria) TaxID=192944 RepID=UPI00363E4B4D